ncbi:universal stress protein [Natronolimnobius baerhuensis]|uniref:Universal stress protein UspA n=1 Tax=Natronolimnobius baerhuensis TaxID=253108 RepID=A0A202E5Z2_9EURY|nr:universal stress protein [Natronolimnobius baerhuensis]OVE83655.1 universal stress protein UspA [Natronolimnobius baerhuensis]
MTRQVLVPIDDSNPARAALEHALTVFDPETAVSVIHVVDDLESGYGGGPTADDHEPAFFDDVETRAADRHLETQVVEGTPADAILEYVDEHGIDQIVMGSEGRAGVSRMLLGSVAENVTRRASVPVTIVPHER